MSGSSRAASSIASMPSQASPATAKPCCASSAPSASRVSGWSSTIRTVGSITALIGSDRPADKRDMRQDDRDAYQSWLIGEILLVGLLGAILALFVSRPS